MTDDSFHRMTASWNTILSKRFENLNICVIMHFKPFTKLNFKQIFAREAMK